MIQPTLPGFEPPPKRRRRDALALPMPAAVAQPVALAGPLVLDLPFPPSVNTYWRRSGNRTILSREARRYRDAVRAVVFSRCGVPAFDGPLSVRLDLYAPTRRRYDADNRPKGVLDALTACGAWADDSQVFLLTVAKRGVRAGGLCRVTIQHDDPATPPAGESFGDVNE
jgi:crossover junction endodeoxyribonuclease RusA